MRSGRSCLFPGRKGYVLGCNAIKKCLPNKSNFSDVFCTVSWQLGQTSRKGLCLKVLKKYQIGYGSVPTQLWLQVHDLNYTSAFTQWDKVDTGWKKHRRKMIIWSKGRTMKTNVQISYAREKNRAFGTGITHPLKGPFTSLAECNQGLAFKTCNLLSNMLSRGCRGLQWKKEKWQAHDNTVRKLGPNQMHWAPAAVPIKSHSICWTRTLALITLANFLEYFVSLSS